MAESIRLVDRGSNFVSRSSPAPHRKEATRSMCGTIIWGNAGSTKVSKRRACPFSWRRYQLLRMGGSRRLATVFCLGYGGISDFTEVGSSGDHEDSTTF